MQLTVAEREALSGAWNFRDIAEETGIQPGRFFRSSELSSLDAAGRSTVLHLGISDVADLRSDREVERRGTGRVPRGVAIHRLPFRELGAEAPHERGFDAMMAAPAQDADTAAAAERYMVEEYGNYPELVGAQQAIRRVIALLADQRPVITHCFAGKDRTGFTVAIVLEAIGVHQDAIMADYLRSNEALPRLREQILESIRSRATENQTAEILTFAEARMADPVLGVREVYLQTARSVIDRRYGSLAAYLEAIGVAPDQLSRARSLNQ